MGKTGKIKWACLCFFFMAVSSLSSQVDTTHENFHRFTYSDGQVSSEGLLIDGQPNGYWKNYYRDGILRSEGNRKNFKLDSTWVFYTPEGEVDMIINYKDGLKNGLRINYREEEIVTEEFKNDVKHGWEKVFYSDSTLKRKVLWDDGRKEGMEKVYDKEGNITAIMNYDRGFLVSREYINQRDQQGRKQGPWKDFYEDGTLKKEGVYLEGEKHGFFKMYKPDGSLDDIQKWVMGERETRDPAVADAEVKRNYYPTGEVRVMASYLDGELHGVRREFDFFGNVTASQIMEHGKKIAEGIIDLEGMKQGKWKYYYSTGELKWEGQYKDDMPVGERVYYFRNGEVEQRGAFNQQGQETGKWEWFFSNGQLRKMEHYRDGILHGLYEEYTREGKLWSKGEYIEGSREGDWLVTYLGNREQGKYQNDVRQGKWEFIADSILVYEGRFEDGFPDGNHKSYHLCGNLHWEGEYNMGEKNGPWRKYLPNGQLFLVVTYRFGRQVEYNQTQIQYDPMAPPE